MTGDLSRRWLGHVPALLVFLAVSIFWSVQFQDKGVEAIRTSDTTDVFYGIVIEAREQHARYRPGSTTLLGQIWRDQVAAWQSSDMAGRYQGQFNAYLKSVYVVTGDVANSYKMLVAPFNFIYLLGCYLLFLSISGNRGWSLLFSLLASLPIFIPLAGENFGMGPFTNFSRRHLFTAFVPLALYGFYRWRDDIRWLLPVFVFFGLIANLHASGILFIEIAALAYFLLHPFSRGHLFNTTLLFGAAFAAGFIAIGRLWTEVAGFIGKITAALIPAAQAADFDLKAGIVPSVHYLFYPPHIYSHLPEILVHLLSIAVFFVALSPLFLRNRVAKSTYGMLLFLSSLCILAFLGFSELKFWLIAAIMLWLLAKDREPSAAQELAGILILSIYLIGFVLTVVFQFAHLFLDDFPAIFNNLRGARFIGLFVFVWLVALLRQIDYAKLAKAARIGLVFVVTLAILTDLRHLVRDNFRQPRNKEEVRSLLQVAEWARDNTPLDARFFVASSAFGVVSERGVYMLNKAIHQCPDCAEATLNADVNALLASAREKGMDYVLLKKPASATRTPVYENQHYALLPVNDMP